MTVTELELLDRAHRLFAARPQPVALDGGLQRFADLLERTADAGTGPGHAQYRQALLAQRNLLRANARTDAAATALLAAAFTDHARARQQTGAVVAAARADAAASSDTPLAQREAMRRRAARLRAQRTHVLSARHRAQAHRARIGRLRYRARHRLAGSDRLRLPNTRGGLAVRAALSRLGRPYVWGATGPDRFDCSGLTQWAYRQAGVPLSRTTYTQIHEGIPVPRSQIQPGDLVFPSTGHVQLAIGDNMVVEAPHAGATVRVSPLGAHVAIRRPVL